MSSIYKLSKAAERDLEQLYRYTITQFSVIQANHYLEELERALILLAEFPAMGRSAEMIRPNLRSYVHQSHTIYYRIREKDILIVRVINQRMDHKSLM